MNSVMKHMDCRNFVAWMWRKVYAIARRNWFSRTRNHCEHLSPTQKCKFCVHFVSRRPISRVLALRFPASR